MRHVPDRRAMEAARTISAALPLGDLRINGIDVVLPQAAADMQRELLKGFARGDTATLLIEETRDLGRDDELLRALVGQNKIIEG
jgi:hypothetical protein